MKLNINIKKVFSVTLCILGLLVINDNDATVRRSGGGVRVRYGSPRVRYVAAAPIVNRAVVVQNTDGDYYDDNADAAYEEGLRDGQRRSRRGSNVAGGMIAGATMGGIMGGLAGHGGGGAVMGGVTGGLLGGMIASR